MHFRDKAAIAGLAAATILTAPAKPANAQYTVTTFSPSVFNSNTAAMDATLGITGFQIEDFEDVNLLPGLSVQFQNPNAGPISVLPTTFAPGSNPPFSANEVWDGTKVLVNQADQTAQPNGPFNNISDVLTFLYQPGTTVFGIGLSDFQTENAFTELFVNGVSLGRVDQLPNYVNGFPNRNLYLKITASANTAPITSVEFRKNNKAEYLFFDHVAVSPAAPQQVIPEPGTCALLATGLLPLVGMVARRRRG